MVSNFQLLRNQVGNGPVSKQIEIVKINFICYEVKTMLEAMLCMGADATCSLSLKMICGFSAEIFKGIELLSSVTLFQLFMIQSYENQRSSKRLTNNFKIFLKPNPSWIVNELFTLLLANSYNKAFSFKK